jgi:hypothetical protein
MWLEQFVASYKKLTKENQMKIKKHFEVIDLTGNPEEENNNEKETSNIHQDQQQNNINEKNDSIIDNTSEGISSNSTPAEADNTNTDTNMNNNGTIIAMQPRNITWRNRSQKCPYELYSFLCTCERRKLSREYTRANDNTIISNGRIEQICTTNINKILMKYNSVYADDKLVLPCDFYHIALRAMLEMPEALKSNKRKNRPDEEYAEQNHLKFPLFTEFRKDNLDRCKDAIPDFDGIKSFKDKDKVNILFICYAISSYK